MPSANDPVNPYFSEAGPGVFDAALTEHISGHEDRGDVIRSEVFCTVSSVCVLGRAVQLICE